MINDDGGALPWQQVTARIRHLIRSGQWRANTRLPTARELAEQWGVGMNTIAKATDELRREGLIQTHRNQGSYVCHVPRLTRLATDRYKRTGRSPNMTEAATAGIHLEISGKRTVCAADASLAERLLVDVGADLSRVDYFWTTGDDQPVQVSTQWEPLAVTRGTSAELPPTNGHPDVISRFDAIGIHVDRVEEETSARIPTSEEAKLLNTAVASAVLDIRRTHFSGDTPVETADITIRGDRMCLLATHHVAVDDSDDQEMRR